MKEQKVVVILGPTAAGKTAAAIETAKRLNGEIISADSMQIYRGMDIGTAKPTRAEMQGIPHHLIDEIGPDEPYSVSLFQKRAFEVIADLHSRGKTPIVCGGTGLYLNALTYDLDFTQTGPDEACRSALKELIAEKGLPAAYALLQEKSPEDAARIHPNDEKRIVRRLEILSRPGEAGKYDFLKEREGYAFTLIGLTMPRPLLYERINERVDQMLSAGLEDEVHRLYAAYGGTLQSLQGIGYKEMIAYLEGRCSLSEAADKIKQATRNFAKRQFTWFLRDKRIKWFDTTYYPCLKDLIDDIIKYMK